MILKGKTSQKQANSEKKIVYSLLILLIIGILYLSEVASNTASTDLEFAFSAVFSMVFSILPIAYLLWKGMRIKEAIKSLGLNREVLNRNTAMFGVLTFIIIVLMEFLVSAISSITGTAINTNVDTLLGMAPTWFLIFASLIVPVNEEIFFRGFLINGIDNIYSMVLPEKKSGKRQSGNPSSGNFLRENAGIVIAATIFGLLHASYGSTFGIEIIAAFIFGIITGYVFKNTKSLYPSIIAHILVNSLTVLSFL